ncbi:MAG: hypothetical protein ABSA15_06845 [Thermoplasmata archaeon]|jgi:hypothetical protein
MSPSKSPTTGGDSAVDPSAEWRSADHAIRSLEVGPGVIRWLAHLSGEGGESAWTKPALITFYEEKEGQTDTAERFFAELRELVLAVQAVEVGRRYAPWASVTAIADVPTSTLDPATTAASPSVWLARWVGCCQRIAGHFEELKPFLANLAEESPIVPEEESVGISAGEAGVAGFAAMLDALIEPIPERIAIPGDPPGVPREEDAQRFRALLRDLPIGPIESALRGRTVRFTDGVEIRFLRFPRLGDLSWDLSPSRLYFQLDADPARLPAGVAATLGAYVGVAAPVLAAEATAFAQRCARARDRLRTTFSTELVTMALTEELPNLRPGDSEGL